MPRVSLIMTVQNGEQYLANALSSLAAQSFTDTEIVVVDNGSTDTTAKILNEFGDRRLKIITVDPNPNNSFATGISKAFNAATGEYVAVQDSDDFSCEDRIEKQVRFLETAPEVGLIGTGVEWIDKNNDHLCFQLPLSKNAELMQQYAKLNPLAHSSVMFRRALANQFGGYNTNFSHACDYRMALDFMYAKYTVSALNEPLVKIRQHSNQQTAQPHTALIRSWDQLALLEYAQDLPFLTKASRSEGLNHITKAKFQIVLNLIHKNEKLDALKFFCAAALDAPLYLIMYVIVRTLRGQLGDTPRPHSKGLKL